MQIWTFVMGLAALMILVLGIFAIIQARKQAEIRKEHPGYPEGYWTSRGVGIGVALGMGIGVALDNIALGVGVGVAIGTAIGAGLEKQHADEIRPLTEQEKVWRRQSLIVTAVTLVIGVAVFLAVFFLQ